MVEVFDTTEGRAFYKLCIRLDMDSFRNQAQVRGAITTMQNRTLMALTGSGPDVHNGRLLQMVAEGNTLEKYRALADTVMALGHHGPYTQFTTFLEGETGEVVGMANKDSTIKRLEKCCKNDNSATFSEVLERASKEFLHEVYENDKNDGGWRTVGAYLLCVAVQMEAIQCLRIILAYVKPNVKGKDGVTPLHKAAGLNSPNVAEVLLKHGAEVNATTCSGYSPIHRATRGGNVETLLLLCSAKDARLNLKTGSGGETPLHIAVLPYASNGPECVRILLDGGARADIRDSRNCTAREKAVEGGHQDILGLLNKAVHNVQQEPMEAEPAETQGTPSSSSADQHDRSRPSNPWESRDYTQWYHKLIEVMHPSQVKNLCFSLQLLDKYNLQDIDAKPTDHAKNSEILARLSSCPEKFGQFREIVRHLNGWGLKGIVGDLDKLGPDRENDRGCFEARRTLEK